MTPSECAEFFLKAYLRGEIDHEEFMRRRIDFSEVFRVRRLTDVLLEDGEDALAKTLAKDHETLCWVEGMITFRPTHFNNLIVLNAVAKRIVRR